MRLFGASIVRLQLEIEGGKQIMLRKVHKSTGKNLIICWESFIAHRTPIWSNKVRVERKEGQYTKVTLDRRTGHIICKGRT